MRKVQNFSPERENSLEKGSHSQFYLETQGQTQKLVDIDIHLYIFQNTIMKGEKQLCLTKFKTKLKGLKLKRDEDENRKKG
ncbi:unnamed protein product [Orchesella dallaii]|uniref:Uncharacterized protein n=1 Tax=Orchesella dallaii TaxID=48710 RepID=A0ABP1PI70_9HEXA